MISKPPDVSTETWQEFLTSCKDNFLTPLSSVKRGWWRVILCECTQTTKYHRQGDTLELSLPTLFSPGNRGTPARKGLTMKGNKNESNNPS